jgi:glycosyltransferase involved in cell wall biosynthesis
MKILHLIQTSGPGGAEKLLLSLTQNSKDKYTHVAGLLRNGWLYNKLQDQGVEVKIIPSGDTIDLKLIKNLVNLIKKEKIGLIHSHLLDMNFYSSIASRLTGVPQIATEHGDVHHISKKVNIKTYIKVKFLYMFSTKVVFVSRFTQDKFSELVHVSKEKTEIIYNGINLEEYQRPIDIKKKRMEVGITTEYVVGNVGNLYPVKGQTYLLKAAKKVLEEIPNTIFLIIGRGELEKDLRKEAKELGIDSDVKFLEFREDVKELLKIMDVFVLPSLSEGLPFSLIEAMASQVPVIATKVGGIPEVINDGENGFLVPPYDPGELAAKIIRLSKDCSFANHLTIHGLKTIGQEFNLSNMLRRYSEIYSHVSSRV